MPAAMLPSIPTPTQTCRTMRTSHATYTRRRVKGSGDWLRNVIFPERAFERDATLMMETIKWRIVGFLVYRKYEVRKEVGGGVG